MLSCELFAGTVVTIGTTTIVAIGQENVGRDIVIAASTLPEFIRQAVWTPTAAFAPPRTAAPNASELEKW